MNLNDFKINLDKLSSGYEIGGPASEVDFALHESRLGILLPEQVKQFYRFANGIKVSMPRMEVYPLSEIENIGGHLFFCKFAGIHELAFDASELNAANQWNIVNANTGYLVTLTMASFWSNKVWVWLRQRREIWAPEVHT